MGYVINGKYFLGESYHFWGQLSLKMGLCSLCIVQYIKSTNKSWQVSDPSTHPIFWQSWDFEITSYCASRLTENYENTDRLNNDNVLN